MDVMMVRKRRLERLLELAQTYRGWSRKELARTLGRDPTKLVPGTGIPKLDLVVHLSGVLDWPVGDVVAFLWDHDRAQSQAAEAKDFQALDEEARQAHRKGQYELMAQLAQEAYTVATTPEERARACNRQAGAWDGLGRYSEVLKSVNRGMQETGVSLDFRRMLQSNLANAYYCLWALVESRSISQDLIRWYEDHPPQTARDRKTSAFAHYVSGHSHRRLISVEPDRSRELAALAKEDLQVAQTRYLQLAEELGDESLQGIANTCYGGLIEADVELGRRSASDALAELSKGLDEVLDTSEAVVGDRLESYGWWCIFGCNIALRHLSNERELQQHMAVLTNKADEIANQLDNWAMRERVFTMHYTRWERATGSTGFDIPCVIDTDDVRIITGTMGRFPTFRDTGWRILQSAQVVDGK